MRAPYVHVLPLHVCAPCRSLFLAGSFVPVFGKGDPVLLDEDSDEEYWEHMRKKAKSKSKQDSDNGKEPSEGAPKSGKDKDKPVPSSWQFGWVNIVIIFGIGAIACIKMGMFDGACPERPSPDTCPYQILHPVHSVLACLNLLRGPPSPPRSSGEMKVTFLPSLPPIPSSLPPAGDNVPDFVAKRDDLQYYFKSLAAPEVSETEEEDGKPKRDPFAAPEDEEPTRY